MLLQITEPTSSIVQEKLSQAHAVGIDLGTTNSVVAYSQDHKPRVLSTDQGDNLLPSVVAYLQNGMPNVGTKALEMIETAPESVIMSSKRLMGRSAQEAKELAHMPLAVIEEESNQTVVRIKVGGHIKTPVEVAADILRTLKRQAESSLGQAIEKAVITVPAYFDEAARQATKDAADLAGLKVLRLINEPTAAALAYGLDHGLEGVYAIYDLGGGTFDFSLLRLTKGVFQVLATGGDRALGGDDIDHMIVTHMQSLSAQPKLTLSQKLQALKLARRAKEYLTTHDSGMWTFIDGKDYFLDCSLLEELSTPLIERTIDICRQVMIDANLQLTDIKGIVLVGGATRMPAIRERVAELFKQLPLTDLDPDTVVAMGAALQAEALTKGSDNLLLDVTPLSLGLETMGGLVEKIIPRNTPIPTSVQQEFTTATDGQTSMKIHVLQGEREFVKDCRSLADFNLTDIPPMAAGAARIKVSFMVDADGLLTVTAQEEATKVSQEIIVKPYYGLTEDDYRRILAENATHGAKDIKERLLIESKMKAQQLLDHLNKAIMIDGDLLTKLELTGLEDAMTTLEQCLTQKDNNAIVDQHKIVESLSTPFASRRVQRLISNTEMEL